MHVSACVYTDTPPAHTITQEDDEWSLIRYVHIRAVLDIAVIVRCVCVPQAPAVTTPQQDWLTPSPEPWSPRPLAGGTPATTSCTTKRPSTRDACANGKRGEATWLSHSVCFFFFFLSSSGGKSTQILYLSKSTNTAIYKYFVRSKSQKFKIYLSKSTKVLASKCT